MKKTLPPSASAHSSLFMNWRFENMGFCQRSRGQYLLCYNQKHEGTRTLDLLNHFTSPGSEVQTCDASFMFRVLLNTSLL